MCCRKMLLLGIALSGSYLTIAQTNASVYPLQKLLSAKQAVTVNWRDKAIAITDSPFNTFPQQLLKTSAGLYLFVNGSGRLYQLHDSGAGLQAQRIDSTIFFGYNLGSFPFVYHDTIYSLGGYGIWRINGQLRTYIPQAHSWDIVPLNEEVPVLMQEDNHDLICYNEQSNRLYIGYSIQRNQAIKLSSLNDASFDYTVRCLNLQTKEWKTAGTLNDYFKDKLSLLKNIAFTPWGQLVSFGDKLLLIDYANNQLLHLKEGVENTIRPVLFQYPATNLYYCLDSTLYFGNIAENRISSLALHLSDFVKAGITVYEKPLTFTTFINEWIVATLIMLLVAFFIWKRKRNKQLVHLFAPPLTTTDETYIQQPEATAATDISATAEVQETKNDATTLIAKPALPFDEKEMQVIHLIWKNSNHAYYTTVEELNSILGLAKKTPDTQKVQRNNTLRTINNKYKKELNVADDLIESKPAESDRRSRVYFIATGKEALLAEMKGMA